MMTMIIIIINIIISKLSVLLLILLLLLLYYYCFIFLILHIIFIIITVFMFHRLAELAWRVLEQEAAAAERGEPEAWASPVFVLPPHLLSDLDCCTFDDFDRLLKGVPKSKRLFYQAAVLRAVPAMDCTSAALPRIAEWYAS